MNTWHAGKALVRKSLALRRAGLGGELHRYAIASGVSAILSLSLPLILHRLLGFPEEPAVAASLTIVFLNNFFVFRLFVFRSAAPAVRQLVTFGLVSAAMRGAEYAAFHFIYEVFHVHYWFALVIALSVSFVCKFAVQRRYVFGASQAAGPGHEDPANRKN